MAGRAANINPSQGTGTVPVKAMVPRKYPPFTAAGLVLFEADYISVDVF